MEENDIITCTVHQCRICDLKFPEYSLLETHCSLHHKTSKTDHDLMDASEILNSDTAFYQCTVCNYVFLRSKDLKNHFKLHRENGTVATDHGVSLSKPYSLFQEFLNVDKDKDACMRNEATEQPFIALCVNMFNCEICNIIYLNQTSLDKHNYVRHRESAKLVQFPKEEIITINDTDSTSSTGAIIDDYRKDEEFAEDETKVSLLSTDKSFSPATLTNIIDINYDSNGAVQERTLIPLVSGAMHNTTDDNDPKDDCSSESDEIPLDADVVCDVADEFNGADNEPNKIFESFISIEVTTKRPQTRKSTASKKSYECDACGKTFKSPCALKDHHRIHTGEKPFHCDLCNKSFRLKNILVIHKRIHTGERPYDCDVCGKSFTQLSSRHRHRLIHNIRNMHPCSFCGQMFRIRRSVRDHMKLHNTNDALEPLEKFHIDGKPFNCDVCGGSFSRIEYLKVHLEVHD